MKIAFYSPNKPLAHPDPSGDQTIARTLVQALDTAGHQCVETAVFRARWFWKSPEGWARAAQALARSWRFCRSWRPDLWLTYHTYYKAPDVIGPWITRLFKIPYVLFQPMFSTKRRRDPATRRGFYLNRIALLSCCHAVTNNRNDIPALERILPADAVSYIPPGIFPERFQRNTRQGEIVRRKFRIPPEAMVLITVARFRPGVKWESLSFLVDALSLLDSDTLPFRILLVGDGPKENDLRRKASRLLGEKAVFCGRVSSEELFRYYSAADLFVFPGIGESLGMVYLEAQACQLPVVALRQPGVEQVVRHGTTGMLVSGHNPQDYAQTVNDLLRKPEKRCEMARRAALFVSRHRNAHRNYRHLADLLSVLNTSPHCRNPDHRVMGKRLIF